jgi:hypothetical protein
MYRRQQQRRCGVHDPAGHEQTAGGSRPLGYFVVGIVVAGQVYSGEERERERERGGERSMAGLRKLGELGWGTW